jgi:hypothetical protein
LAKVEQISVKRDRCDVVRLVKLSMNRCYGRHARGGIVELTCSGPRGVSMHVQQARHDLQAVLDAVIDLFDQQVLLPSAFFKGTLCLFKFCSFV